MPTIRCKHPVRLDKTTHQRLRQAGFVFTNLSTGKVGPYESHGFTELRYVGGTLEELIERLAGLHYSDISRIYSNLYDTEVGKAIEQAEHTITLRRLAQLPNDGFPFGITDTRPATWDLHFQIPAELASLEEKLKPFGITQVRVGQEIEFGLEKDPVPGNNHWITVRDKALADLEYQTRNATTPEEKSRLEAKTQKLATFNAREILMYDIIELDPRTKNIVEYLFGNTTADDTSYYDQANCLELKLKHAPLQEYVRNHQTLLRVLVEKVTQYGTIFFQVLNSNQINLSFWDEQGNLQDPEHPEFTTKGAAIAAGVVRSVSQALPIFRSDYKMDKSDAQPITLQTNRDGMLRASPGRIEIRPENHSGGEQHPEMMVTVAVAGGLHGLRAYSGDLQDPGMKPVTFTTSPIVKVPDNKFKMFSHVLASCQVMKDGSIIPAKYYTQERAIHMAYEFGISPDDPDKIPPC
jgi:hypothetical protein